MSFQSFVLRHFVIALVLNTIHGDPGADSARKTQVFWHQSEARTAATVWNWSGKTLSPGALLAVLYFSFVPYFSASLDFRSPPLSASGSPRMGGKTKSPCFDLFIHWLIKQITNTYRNLFQGNTKIALTREQSKVERCPYCRTRNCGKFDILTREPSVIE